MIIVGWTATIISIIGIILNARKNILCWPVWLTSNILWIIYFIPSMDMPSIILWVVFSMFNVYGWMQWKKDKKIKNENK
jgi:nicotinamide mononucleotide transporter